jgi:hypothetical protein
VKTRFRLVKQHPHNGGKVCKEAALKEVGPCISYGCEPEEVHCSWHQWGAWSKCSAECGSAYRSRKRKLGFQPLAEHAILKQYDNASLSRISELHLSKKRLEESHLQDLTLSFLCGGLSLVVALGAVRFLRNSRDHGRGWQQVSVLEEQLQRRPLDQ